MFIHCLCSTPRAVQFPLPVSGPLQHAAEIVQVLFGRAAQATACQSHGVLPQHSPPPPVIEFALMRDGIAADQAAINPSSRAITIDIREKLNAFIKIFLSKKLPNMFRNCKRKKQV